MFMSDRRLIDIDRESLLIGILIADDSWRALQRLSTIIYIQWPVHNLYGFIQDMDIYTYSNNETKQIIFQQKFNTLNFKVGSGSFNAV